MLGIQNRGQIGSDVKGDWAKGNYLTLTDFFAKNAVTRSETGWT